MIQDYRHMLQICHRVYIEFQIVKIIFVKSVDNNSDFTTKILDWNCIPNMGVEVFNETCYVTNLYLDSGTSNWWDPHIWDESAKSAVCAKPWTDQFKIGRVSKCFFILWLNHFELEGVFQKLLDQFHDWWPKNSMEIWVSILQNTTSAKWIIILEICWTLIGRT